jgi:phage FluMu protein Com
MIEVICEGCGENLSKRMAEVDRESYLNGTGLVCPECGTVNMFCAQDMIVLDSFVY